MSKFRTAQVKPTVGGRLMTGASADTAGLSNYTIKRDFRRVLDKEVLAEGYDLFAPNPMAPVQPVTGGEAITLVTMARQPNNRTTVVVGTPTRLWAYMLNDGACVEDGYLEAQTDVLADDAPEWILIGSGFSAQGRRWEALNINGYLVMNNGVDLPVTYRVGDLAVKPIYELREQGVASVGTISVLDGILICKDLKLIQESVLSDVLYPIPLGEINLSPPIARYWRFPTGAVTMTPGAGPYHVGQRFEIAGTGTKAVVEVTSVTPSHWSFPVGVVAVTDPGDSANYIVREIIYLDGAGVKARGRVASIDGGWVLGHATSVEITDGGNYTEDPNPPMVIARPMSSEAPTLDVSATLIPFVVTTVVVTGGEYSADPGAAVATGTAETFAMTAVQDAEILTTESIPMSDVTAACESAGVARATARVAEAQDDADRAAEAYAAATTALVRANAALAGVSADAEVASINAALSERSSDVALQAAGVAALNAAASLQNSTVSASGDLQAAVTLATSGVKITKTAYETATATLVTAQGGLADANARGDDYLGIKALVDADPTVLIGMRLMWDGGMVAFIAGVDGGVVTLDRVLTVTGNCVMENPLCYAAFTDETKIDHYQARVTWAMPSQPRRFGAIVPCTAYANRDYILMAYPAKSVKELQGANFLFPGIGPGEGNLTLTARLVCGRHLIATGASDALASLRTAATDAALALMDSAAAAATATFSLEAAKASLTAAQQAMISGVKTYPGALDSLDASRASLVTAQDDLDRVTVGATFADPLDTGLRDKLALATENEALWLGRLSYYDSEYWDLVVIGYYAPKATTKSSYSDAKLATIQASNAVSAQEALIAANYGDIQQAISDIPALSSYSVALADANSKVVSAKADADTADAAVTANQAILASARARVSDGVATNLMASDASGSIVGLFEDITDDGSRILKGMPLRGVLVIYKETSIFLMAHTNNVAAPFQFERVAIPPGTNLYYRDTLAMIEGMTHVYAGSDQFYRFDLNTRVPQEMVNELQPCQETFFKSADLEDDSLIFAADNPLTNEIFFCFPENEDGDCAMRYDYRHGTTSTTSAAYTAGGFVRRPEAVEGRDDWFVVGTRYGVMRYGISKSKPIPSGDVSASRTGAVVTASDDFFTETMVGKSIQFSDGNIYAITGYIDAKNVTVLVGYEIEQPDVTSLQPAGTELVGLPQVYQSDGDPNGVITAQSPAICLDRANKVTWWKTDGKTSNKGWR